MKKLFLVLVLLISINTYGQIVPTVDMGELRQSATAACLFHTYRQDTGASETLAGTPAVKVYKDADDTSEVTTGLTLTADFDSTTGLNSVAVDTSNAFYAIGHDYSIVITAGTVNSVSVVGNVPCRFSIGNRGDDLGFVNHGSTGSTAGKMELVGIKITPPTNGYGIEMPLTNGATGISIYDNGNSSSYGIDVETGNEALILAQFTGSGTSAGHNAVKFVSDNEFSATFFINNIGARGEGLQIQGGVANANGAGAPGVTIFGGDASADNIAGPGIISQGGGSVGTKAAGPSLQLLSGEADGTHGYSTVGADAAVVVSGDVYDTGYGFDPLGGGNAKGVLVIGGTDKNVVTLTGNGTGKAINALGQVNIDAGAAVAVNITSTGGQAINVEGQTALLQSNSGISRSALYIESFGGAGVVIGNDNDNHAALEIEAFTNGDAIRLTVDGTGKAINALGQVYIAPTGNTSGLVINSGDTADFFHGAIELNGLNEGNGVIVYPGTGFAAGIALLGTHDFMTYNDSYGVYTDTKLGNVLLAEGSAGVGLLISSAGQDQADVQIGGGIVTAATAVDGVQINPVGTGKGINITSGGIVGSLLAIPKDVAYSNFMLKMVLSSDNKSPATGKMPACTISKDGGSFSACTNTPATEIANGWYKIDLTDTEMNADSVVVRFTAAGANTYEQIIRTNP